jgi:hypothetical protein
MRQLAAFAEAVDDGGAHAEDLSHLPNRKERSNSGPITASGQIPTQAREASNSATLCSPA